MVFDRWSHWEWLYRTRDESEFSWFQQDPRVSLELIEQTAAHQDARIIDIGCGASRLVDALVFGGYTEVTVLDLSETALSTVRARIGDAANHVSWIAADVTRWAPSRAYDLWHDRAAFHFLTNPDERTAYVDRLTTALAPEGHAIIGTFAMDGPNRCSNLPVERYDAARLSAALGPGFRLIDSRRHCHQTPAGQKQSFHFGLFQREGRA